MARLTLVVDASAFIDAMIQHDREDVEEALRAFDLIAPGNFPTEVAAMLLREQRQGASGRGEILLSLQALETMAVRTHAPSLSLVIEVAQKHSLTAYDAAYLASALESGARLVTVDKALANAARAEGCLWSIDDPDYRGRVSFMREKGVTGAHA